MCRLQQSLIRLVLSRKVGKLFRDEAMKQGEFVMLYRAYCGNNGHKRKISVAVRPTESHRTNLTLN